MPRQDSLYYFFNPGKKGALNQIDESGNLVSYTPIDVCGNLLNINYAAPIKVDSNKNLTFDTSSSIVFDGSFTLQNSSIKFTGLSTATSSSILYVDSNGLITKGAAVAAAAGSTSQSGIDSNNAWTGTNTFLNDVSFNNTKTQINSTSVIGLSGNIVNISGGTINISGGNVFVAGPTSIAGATNISGATIIAGPTSILGAISILGPTCISGATSLTSNDIYLTNILSMSDLSCITYNPTTKQIGYTSLPNNLPTNNTWTGTNTFTSDVSLNSNIYATALASTPSDTNCVSFNTSTKKLGYTAIPAAPSTLLASNNTWTGKNLFGGDVSFNGNTNITSGQLYSNNLLLQGDGTNAYIRPTNTLSSLYLGSSNNNNMVIDSVGNVGIGTTNPQQKLCITGNGTTNTRLLFTDTSVASSRQSWAFAPYNGDLYGLTMGDNGTVGGQNWLQIVRKPGGSLDISCVTFPNGNVGIGTTAPKTKLDVVSSSGSYARFQADTNDINQKSGIEFGIPAFTSDQRAKITSITQNSDASDLKFYTNSAGSTAALARMTITKDGNVGIGEENPASKLHVNGNTTLMNGSGATDTTVINGYMEGASKNTNPFRAQLTIKSTTAGSERLYLGSYYSPGNACCCIQTSDYYYDNGNFLDHGNNLALNPLGGYVGIGTTTPSTKLHIAGVTASPIYDNSGYWFNNTNPLTRYNTNAFGADMSVYSEGGISAFYFAAFSDKRIKNNILDIDDEKALSILRQIKPKTYDYVDTLKNGNLNVVGFIAQEIKEIIPKAVKMNTDYIPNFMTRCQVSATDVSNIVLVSTPIDLSWNPLHGSANASNASDVCGNAFIDADGNAASDASGNKFFNVKLYDKSNNEIICKTTNILDKRNFLMDVSSSKISFDSSGNVVLENNGEYFLYGQEVDDFHILDKNAIFTVVTAAVQDIDRIVQAQNVQVQAQAGQIQAQAGQIQAQNAQVQILESTVATLESKNASLESKNASLESTVATLQQQLAAQQEQINAILAKLT